MRTHLPVSLTAAALASLLLIGGEPGRAQTIITGVHKSADGADVTGIGNPNLTAGSGQFTLDLSSVGPVLVQHATVTGGNGGNVTTLPGTTGYGGGGSASYDLTIRDSDVTIQSGVFTGGDGGSATGTASEAEGGNGGEGFRWLTDSPHTLTINGGTFRGGRGGDANNTSAAFGGGGRDAADIAGGHGQIAINGGTFIGGSGGDATGAGPNRTYGGFGCQAVGINGGAFQIAGGSFTHGLVGAGGQGGIGNPDFEISDGQVVFRGSGFTFGGVSNYFGRLPAGYGSFSGKLAHNSSVTTISYFLDGSTSRNYITLAPVPEFSTVASFGALLLLGVGGLALKSRRGKENAD